jgi:hypothetical protein
MADEQTGVRRFFVGKYVCPETDELISVTSALPLAEMDCHVVVETCPSCGERHEVCCDDLLDTEEIDQD